MFACTSGGQYDHFVVVKARKGVLYENYSTRSVVESRIQHSALPRAETHTPSAIYTARHRMSHCMSLIVPRSSYSTVLYGPCCKFHRAQSPSLLFKKQCCMTNIVWRCSCDPPTQSTCNNDYYYTLERVLNPYSTHCKAICQ
jgi:hypothetical protein